MVNNSIKNESVNLVNSKNIKINTGKDINDVDESLNLDDYLIEVGNFVFFGSAHVSNKTKIILESAFEQYQFDRIALELDLGRFQSLLENKKPKFRDYLRMPFGIFWYILGRIQLSFAKNENTRVGNEMLTAVALGAKNNAQIYLIDIPIEITMNRIKKQFGLKTVFKIVRDLFRKEKIDVNVDDFVDLDDNTINFALGYMKKHYPEFYNPLLKERNQYMAQQLYNIYVYLINEKDIRSHSEFETRNYANSIVNYKNKLNSKDTHKNHKVLVIVGKAHIKGVISEFKKLIKQYNEKRDVKQN